jgi:hypothetical protein
LVESRGDNSPVLTACSLEDAQTLLVDEVATRKIVQMA